MKLYYFNNNTDSNGNHEVHTSDCSHLPSPSNCILIGFFSSCSDAIKEARKANPSKSFDGCIHCCKPCHKG